MQTSVFGLSLGQKKSLVHNERQQRTPLMLSLFHEKTKAAMMENFKIQLGKSIAAARHKSHKSDDSGGRKCPAETSLMFLKALKEGVTTACARLVGGPCNERIEVVVVVKKGTKRTSPK